MRRAAAAAAVCAALAAAAGADPVAVCVTDPLDRLPAGVAFEVSDALLARSQEPPPPTTRRRARTPPSDFERRDFPVVHTRPLEWLDGSQVKLTCTLRQTMLHELEARRYVVAGAARVRDHPAGAGPQTAWREFRWELRSDAGVNPSYLDCETEAARVDALHPYAAPEKLAITIDQMRDLLFPDLVTVMRSETSAERCAAIRAAAAP